MRFRGLVISITLVMAATVAGVGVVLRDSNNHSRQQLVQVFDQREGIGASLFEALLHASFETGTVAPGLAARQISGAAIKAASDGYPSAVLAADGRPLASFVPHGTQPVPAAIGGALVRIALRTHQAISRIFGDRQGAYGFTFPTPYGTRVEVQAFPLGTIAQLLPVYMQRLNGRGGESFILDTNDRVISTNLPGISIGAPAPDVALSGAAEHHARGQFSERGATWHFTSAPLVGTEWRIVLAVPDAILFAPVSGPRQLVPWVLISLFGLSCLVVLVLVQRTRRDADRVVVANAKLEQRNQQVEEANEAKSRFLAGMSHELRTPLNGIIGFAELMHDGRVGPMSERHHEFVGDILASGRHLLNLINDVLDISKVEAGKLEFDRRPVELCPLVTEILATIRPLAEDKSITVETEVDPRLGTVELDSSRFRQILLNYVSNAVKFTEPGGRVWIRVAVGPDARLTLEVQDTGVGIAAEEIGALFTEFGQLQRGRAASQPGTGLGLALTKRLVEAQGGRVWVRSVLGTGSVFGAGLPC